MIFIAVCDDDALFAKAVSDKITNIAIRCNINLDVKTFVSGSALLDSAKNGACFDIFFLDVLMGGENGIEIARRLQQYCEGALYIFLTGYIDFAVKGYEVRAFRYLLKDSFDTELEKTLSEAIAELEQKPVYSFSYKNAIYRINPDDIVYFESDKRLIVVHTQKRDYRFYGKLDDVERMTDFIRIHRSYLVNPKHITVLTKTEVSMCGGIVLSVSKSYADAAKRKFMLKLF